MTYSIQIIAVLLATCLCGLTLSMRCPTRSSTEVDTYKVQERLDKLTSDVKEKVFKSEDHKHKRADSSDEDVYDYTLQICTPDKNFPAAYQVDKTQGKKVLLGQSNASYALGGTDWILLIYEDGKKYKSYCDQQNRETWVKVVCETTGADPKMKVIEESRWKKGDSKRGCYYLLELNHKAVCSAKVSKLSSGSIVCIVLFSLVAAYLLFGFLFQRFAKGAKGWEQIPNYTFWRSFGNMTADGCDFVCRRPDRSGNSYKGMADALDIDSSDDDRDDHLLPM